MFMNGSSPPRADALPLTEQAPPRWRGPCAGFGVFALVGALACAGWVEGTNTAANRRGFILTVSPAGLQIPAGGSGYAQVSATRTGSTGDIFLTLGGLPEGVVASGIIPADARSGRFTLVVAGGVAPQTLDNLTLTGQCGSRKQTTGFALTILGALPPSQLSRDQVRAAGGTQSAGGWTNHGLVMEPVAHDLATGSAPPVQNRAGFLPSATPSQP